MLLTQTYRNEAMCNNLKNVAVKLKLKMTTHIPKKKQASVTKFSNILRDEFFFLVFYFRLLQFIAWPWIIHLSITHPGASAGVLAFVQVIEYIIADFQINVFTSSRAINHPIPLHAYM